MSSPSTSLSTVLLHLDGSTRTSARTQLAQHLALAFGARVIGQYSVTPSMLRYPMAMEGAAESFDLLARHDHECRERPRAAFENTCAGSPRVSWSDLRTDGFDDFAQAALTTDLVVVGQRSADDPAAAETLPDFVSLLVIETGRPVLVVPYAGAFASVGQRVLVAWKPTRESARAVSAALPWLERAEDVDVACASEDGPAILAWLDAHGVAAVRHDSSGPDGEAGERLLSLAADCGADLLVMGCYGHSRAREWVLGGATRTVLHAMTLPVLMVH